MLFWITIISIGVSLSLAISSMALHSSSILAVAVSIWALSIGLQTVYEHSKEGG